MTSLSRKNGYLPHVDGLRAIAVLVVIFFHLDAPLLPGGYVGVDVFFVISGFLITSLLKEELENTGHLRLKSFYVRRIRRLAPALLVTLLVTFVFAALVFSPSYLQRSAGALSSSLLSVSNFYFWLEADYFDTSASLKPFLHTWSLSVEEQFYLIWPISVLLAYRSRFKWTLLSLIFLVSSLSLFINFSLADGQSWFLSTYFPFIAELVGNGKSTIFYMLPFRVYEFGVGAALVWLMSLRLPRTIFYDIAFLIGAGLIYYSVVAFDESLIFPYWYALVPCIGAALVIFSGASSRFGFFINNKYLVWVGLISYSLYLVHWPVIVFASYIVGEISVAGHVVVLFLIFILACSLYKFVERPLRHSGFLWERPTFKVGALITFLAMFFVGFHAKSSGGWQWRVGEPIVHLEEVADAEAFHKKYYGGNPGYMSYSPQDKHRKIDIILMGDSHSAHYAYGFNEVLSKRHGYNLYVSGFSCLHLPGVTRYDYHRGCVERTNEVLDEASNLEVGSIVVLSNSWDTENQIARARRLDAEGNLTEESIELDFVIDKIRTLSRQIGGARLVVIGNVPRAGVNLYDVFTRPRPLLFSDFKPENYLGRDRDLRLEKINDRLREAARESGDFVFIDPFDYLCNQESCKNIDSLRRPIYSDSTHLSRFGSLFMAQAIESEILEILNSDRAEIYSRVD